MWLFVIIIAVVVAFLMVKKVIDSETKYNLSFLIKLLLISFGLIVLLVLLLTVSR